MNDANDDFSNNRFEVLYQRIGELLASWKSMLWRKWKKWVFVSFFLFLVVDFLSLASVVMYDSAHGLPIDVTLNNHYSQFVLRQFFSFKTVDHLEKETGKPVLRKHSQPTRADAMLQWRNKPDVVAIWGTESGTTWGCAVTDRQGFVLNSLKAPGYTLEKPKNTYRIVMLGGSTTYGIGASCFESIAVKLENLLNANRIDPDIHRVEVINAGVGGYSSSQELLFYLTEIVHFKPDLVIMYDGWNDARLNRFYAESMHSFRPSSYRSSRTDQFSNVVEDLTSPIATLGNFIKSLGAAFNVTASYTAIDRSINLSKIFWQKVKQKIKSKILDHDTLGVWVREQKLYNPLVRSLTPRMTEIYIENLRRMAALTKSEGTKFAAFLQPIMGVDDKPYDDLFEKPLRNVIWSKPKFDFLFRFYANVRRDLIELADSPNARSACIKDISHVFSSTKEIVYTDSGHLNGFGNQLVAERIAAELIRCQLLQTGDESSKDVY
jgi:hypothetical protein